MAAGIRQGFRLEVGDPLEYRGREMPWVVETDFRRKRIFVETGLKDDFEWNEFWEKFKGFLGLLPSKGRATITISWLSFKWREVRSRFKAWPAMIFDDALLDFLFDEITEKLNQSICLPIIEARFYC